MIKLTSASRVFLALIVSVVLLVVGYMHFRPVVSELYQAGSGWELTTEMSKILFSLLIVYAVVEFIVAGPSFELLVYAINIAASAVMVTAALHFVPLLIDREVDWSWFGEASKLAIVVGVISFRLWIFNSISSHVTGDIQRA